MSTWSNTDAATSKPKFDVMRQVRSVVQLTVATQANSGANTLTFTYSGNVAAAGVVVGQYAEAANLASGGVAGFFSSNNTVSSFTGNTVTFTSNSFGVVPAGTIVDFDSAIAYPASKPQEKTYNADTVLVTPTRMANNTVALGDTTAGWVHIRKKVNGDNTVRYISETLVALANPVAANTSSGNTSFGQIFTGL